MIDYASLGPLLIANRGEIACRVMRTARTLGLRTIAIYSDADATAPHVLSANTAVRIGPAPVGESYLSFNAILAAARQTGARAVHPGYGFLAENADFAAACVDADLIFVGPAPEVIRLMGDKRAAKERMLAAGVRCVPGWQGAAQDEKSLTAAAREVGFPLMIKAAAGGGGRGMRRVERSDDLAETLDAARREAIGAFGDGTLILEAAIDGGRHIEVQIFGDRRGNIIHLGERDCSVQRRHQKIIEEAPAPNLPDATRRAVHDAAVRVAGAIGYEGAGTVEFLVDQSYNVYFMEMNTRLQVEHGVTEAITGEDLVAWQLAVAAGAPLPKRQDQISSDGHAIEVRLYAEDANNGFAPQTGRIAQWRVPNRTAIRVDDALEVGQPITHHYDPMLAKIIAHGTTRDQARADLVNAISETEILGVTSNKYFLRQILTNDTFVTGDATTDFVEKVFPAPADTNSPSAHTRAVAAVLLFDRDAGPAADGWRNSGVARWPVQLCAANVESNLWVETIGSHQRRVSIADQEIIIDVKDTIKLIATAFHDGVLFMDDGSGVFAFQDATYAPADMLGGPADGRVTAAMSGRVLQVTAAKGDRIEKGERLFVLESMKMEHQLSSDISGIVIDVLVCDGEQVQAGQVLAFIDSARDADDG